MGAVAVVAFIVIAPSQSDVLEFLHDYHFRHPGQHSAAGSTDSGPVKHFPVPKIAE